MTLRKAIGGVALALALAGALVLTPAVPAQAQQGWGQQMGPGMMGPGMMGMGPGMMGPGYGMGQVWGMGPGMMGPGMMMGQGYGMACPWCGPMMGPGCSGYQPELNLTANDVKTYFERWLAMTGGTRLKVGNTTERDATTITADIVTKDNNSLVQRYAVDRRSGFIRLAE